MFNKNDKVVVKDLFGKGIDGKAVYLDEITLKKRVMAQIKVFDIVMIVDNDRLVNFNEWCKEQKEKTKGFEYCITKRGKRNGKI